MSNVANLLYKLFSTVFNCSLFFVIFRDEVISDIMKFIRLRREIIFFFDQIDFKQFKLRFRNIDLI